MLSNELETALVTDALTNVYNRHKLDDIMERGRFLLTGAVRLPVSIIMTDIDFFKQVNDTHGHERGDEVLIYVADQIRSCVRGNDLVIRWGGEEFVVLLFGCSLAKGIETAERIRRAVEIGDNGVCPITLSLGVCEYDTGRTCGEMIDRADEALYAAKSCGRNNTRVVYNKKNISIDEYMKRCTGHL